MHTHARARMSILSFNPPSFLLGTNEIRGGKGLMMLGEKWRRKKGKDEHQSARKRRGRRGEERRESAILIGKKEHSIVKPRERMAQSEALHVASTREERERFSPARDSAFSERVFPLLHHGYNRTLSFATLQNGENLTNGLLSTCVPGVRGRSLHPIRGATFLSALGKIFAHLLRKRDQFAPSVHNGAVQEKSNRNKRRKLHGVTFPTRPKMFERIIRSLIKRTPVGNLFQQKRNGERLKQSAFRIAWNERHFPPCSFLFFRDCGKPGKMLGGMKIYWQYRDMVGRSWAEPGRSSSMKSTFA